MGWIASNDLGFLLQETNLWDLKHVAETTESIEIFNSIAIQQKTRMILMCKPPRQVLFYLKIFGLLLHELRSSILDLAVSFQNAQGWASERVFSRWVSKQEWRRCLPPIFEICVDRVACSTPVKKQQITHWIVLECFLLESPVDTCSAFCAKAGARPHSKMQQVRLGIFLPHEVASAFYHFRSGDLFYSMLTGTPHAPGYLLSPCTSNFPFNYWR